MLRYISQSFGDVTLGKLKIKLNPVKNFTKSWFRYKVENDFFPKSNTDDYDCFNIRWSQRIYIPLCQGLAFIVKNIDIIFFYIFHW